MKTIFRMLWNGILLITCGILVAFAYLCEFLGKGFAKLSDWLTDVGDKVYVKTQDEETNEKFVPDMNEVIDT